MSMFEVLNRGGMREFSFTVDGSKVARCFFDLLVFLSTFHFYLSPKVKIA